MPYYMLEDAINVSKKALEEHDFEEQGVDVSLNCGRYLKCDCRLRKLSRNTWMTTTNPTGTSSLANRLDATLFTRRRDSLTSLSRPAKFRCLCTRRHDLFSISLIQHQKYTNQISKILNIKQNQHSLLRI